MTAPKDELSMWPADVELSQAVDLNCVAGMVMDPIAAVRRSAVRSDRFARPSEIDARFRTVRVHDGDVEKLAASRR
jgi:hypothetical protein